MGKLTDIQIRAWIKNGEHFEGRSDGDGLYLSFPENYSSPMWRFRYRFAGKQRIMNMGSFASLPLSDPSSGRCLSVPRHRAASG